MDLSKVDTLIVLQPEFMKAVDRVLAEGELETTKDYLKWNTINQAANYLNYEMVRKQILTSTVE